MFFADRSNETNCNSDAQRPVVQQRPNGDDRNGVLNALACGADTAVRRAKAASFDAVDS